MALAACHGAHHGPAKGQPLSSQPTQLCASRSSLPPHAGPRSMDPSRRAGPRGWALLSEAAAPSPGSPGCSAAPVRRLSALLLALPSVRLISRRETWPAWTLASGVLFSYCLRQIPQTSTPCRRNELFPSSDTLLKRTDPDNTRDVCVMKANDTSGNFPPS